MISWLFNSKGKPIAFEKDKKVFSKKGKIMGSVNDKKQVWGSAGYQGEIIMDNRFMFQTRTGNYARAARAMVTSRSVSSTPAVPPSKAAIAMPSAYRDIEVDEK